MASACHLCQPLAPIASLSIYPERSTHSPNSCSPALRHRPKTQAESHPCPKIPRGRRRWPAPLVGPLTRYLSKIASNMVHKTNSNSAFAAYGSKKRAKSSLDSSASQQLSLTFLFMIIFYISKSMKEKLIINNII